MWCSETLATTASKPSGVGELLEREAPEDRTFGSPRIHCRDVMAGSRERAGEPAVPTADLEHPGGGNRQLVEREVVEIGQPPALELMMGRRRHQTHPSVGASETRTVSDTPGQPAVKRDRASPQRRRRRSSASD